MTRYTFQLPAGKVGVVSNWPFTEISRRLSVVSNDGEVKSIHQLKLTLFVPSVQVFMFHYLIDGGSKHERSLNITTQKLICTIHIIPSEHAYNLQLKRL